MSTLNFIRCTWMLLPLNALKFFTVINLFLRYCFYHYFYFYWHFSPTRSLESSRSLLKTDVEKSSSGKGRFSLYTRIALHTRFQKSIKSASLSALVSRAVESVTKALRTLSIIDKESFLLILIFSPLLSSPPALIQLWWKALEDILDFFYNAKGLKMWHKCFSN